MFAVTYACYHQSRALYKHPAFWIRTTTHKIKCSWLKDSLVPLPHETVFLSKKQGAVSRYVVSVYRHSHYKDKTVVRPSYLLYIGNPITGKTVFLNIMTGPRPLWCRDVVHLPLLICIRLEYRPHLFCDASGMFLQRLKTTVTRASR